MHRQRTIVARGFTLIEAMIAVSLSTVIILVVYSCFRVTAQTISVCNRLALENRLLCAGYTAVIDEVDSWQSLDDPQDPTHQPLRTTPSQVVIAENWHDRPAGGMPQPFSVMRASWSNALCQVPESRANPNAAGDYYFSPAWLPSDQRTWFRGDGAYASYYRWHYLDEYAFGNYALFTRSSIQADSATPVTLVVDRDATRGISLGGNVSLPMVIGVPGAAAENAAWLPDQHKGLMYGLGWYGWLDYLPANAICDFYDTHYDDGAPAQAFRSGRPRILREQQSPYPPDLFTPLLNPYPFPLKPGFPAYNGGGTNSNTYGYLQRTEDDGQNVDETHLAAFLGDYGRITDQGDIRVAANRGRASSRGAFLFGRMVAVTHRTDNVTGVTKDDATVQSLLQSSRLMGGNGRYSHETVTPTFQVMQVLHWQDGDVLSRLLPNQPQAWPEVRIEVRRFMRYQRTVNLCFVRLVDPATGKAIELVFPATGTTLRGARLGRGLDS